MKVARRLAFQPYRSNGTTNGSPTATSPQEEKEASSEKEQGLLMPKESSLQSKRRSQILERAKSGRGEESGDKQEGEGDVKKMSTSRLYQRIKKKSASASTSKCCLENDDKELTPPPSRNGRPGKQSFDAALLDFRNSLPLEDERKLSMHEKPTPATVLEFTSKLNDIKGRRVKECSKRVMPFLKAMQTFSSVIDTYIQADPVIAGLVWGSAKYVILVAFNLLDYVEKLSNMFLQLSNLCPVLDRFEKLFPASERLRDSIFAFYAITIRFCRDVVIFVNKSKLKQMVKALWKDLKSQFSEIEVELSRQQELVDREIELASQEAAKEERMANALFRDDTRQFMRNQLLETKSGKDWRIRKDTEQKQARWDKLLNKVCDYDPTKTYSDYKERRHEDTGSWLYDTEEFTEWNDEGKTKGLWCHGIPGCGKSLLTAGLVDYLFTTRHNDLYICYFFCTYSDPDSLLPRTIIGSIIRQLIFTMGHEYSGLVDDVASVFQGISRPEASKYFAFFTKLVSEIHGDVYVVIDGLDECKDRDRIIVLNTLRKILKKPSPTSVFKLVITSRSELDIRNALQDFVQLEFTPERNEGDIRKYIEFEIPLIQGLDALDEELIEEIISGISKRAKGMFVLAYLLVQELFMENDIDSIKGVLQSLPDELNEIFDRILLRISKERKLAVAMKIFSWLICARRTLTLAEIAEAVSITPRIQQWSERHKQLDNEKMLQNCGSLVVHNKDDDTVRLAHYTVQEYLLSLSSPEMRIDIDQANLEVAEVCLTYLGFSDFKTTIAEVPKEKKMVRKDMYLNAAEFVNTATMPNKHVRRISQVLLNRKKAAASVDANKLFLGQDTEEAMESETRGFDTLCKKYRLLSYAASYWLDHSRNLGPDDGWVWNTFRKFATDESASEFSLSPWDKAKPLIVKTYDLRPLDWALKNDHAGLVRLYLDFFLVEGREGGEPRQELLQIWIPTGDDPKRPLHVACSHGSESVVRLLIEAGADVEIRDDDDLTPLQAASHNGHVGVVDVLIENGADVNAAAGRKGYTALQGAASGGHLAVVRTLLENNADVDAEETEFGRTALHGAVLSENLEVVEEILLACSPASILSRGWMSSPTPMEIAAEQGNVGMIVAMIETLELSPLDDKTTELIELQMTSMLHTAIKHGKIDVIEVLLSQGVDANSRDGIKRTPLLTAILAHQREIVKLLLENGADPNAEVLSLNGINALQAAAKVGDVVIMQILIDSGADVNAQFNMNDGLTALRVASSWGQMESVEFLLQHGADVNLNGWAKTGCRNALESAVKEGQLSVVRRLLIAGAKIQRPDAVYMAADRGSLDIFQALDSHQPVPREQLSESLRIACFEGHIELVDYILDKKIEVNERGSYPRGAKPFGNRRLETALQCAAGGGRRGVVERLLRAKADVNAFAATEEGRTALAAAAEIGHLGIVQRLLRAKANVNAPAGGVAGGRTALQAAAENGHKEVVVTLLSNHANYNAAASDVDGRTALQAAAEAGHTEIVVILLAAGANINAPAGYRGGRTALQAAAENRQAEMVRVLLENRANVNAPAGEWKGKTALQCAASSGDFNIVSVLLTHGADINAPPAPRDGQTAVYCAAGAGYLPIHVQSPLSWNFPTDMTAVLSNALPAPLLSPNKPSSSSHFRRRPSYGGDEEEGSSDSEDDLPVHRATLPTYYSILKLFLEKGGDPNARATLSDKGTPLHLAAEHGHLLMVSALLEHGADREAINLSGKTAVELAMERMHGSVVEKILGFTPANKDKETTIGAG